MSLNCCQRVVKMVDADARCRACISGMAARVVKEPSNLLLCMQVLRKLRKLAWAENEAYLVRVMLKAVKGRFSQVPQVASLASGLARYHPSLGVAFVDALLEEVSKFASSYWSCQQHCCYYVWQPSTHLCLHRQPLLTVKLLS